MQKVFVFRSKERDELLIVWWAEKMWKHFKTKPSYSPVSFSKTVASLRCTSQLRKQQVLEKGRCRCFHETEGSGGRFSHIYFCSCNEPFPKRSDIYLRKDKMEWRPFFVEDDDEEPKLRDSIRTKYLSDTHREWMFPRVKTLPQMSLRSQTLYCRG